MRPIFHPDLVNGSVGDPVLFVDCMFEQRALLFDLGDIRALAPRKLLRVSHIFVSHAHMDHFIGFDWLLRILLGREKDLQLFGPPGFLVQVEHKLRAYTWNLVHNYTSNLTLHVTELNGNEAGLRASFHCRNAFRRENETSLLCPGNVLLNEPAMQVRCALLDHGGIPCLAYALEEQAHINVWKNRLQELGLPLGPWLRDLKQAVLRNDPEQRQIRVAWREDGMEQERMLPLAELKSALRIVPGQKIVYVTDVAWLEDNIRDITELARNANMLFIEAVFMERDAEHGRRKFHLTARQAGELAHAAGVGCVIPLHFSSRYRDNDRPLLRAEVAAAFGGTVL
ncbi:ribonuclease Z [Candidatus Nitrotoga sp. 1052]|uniref:ribonuclease Z n=1 Tax=Candidatus Nitrotoga sp. 1052 TaxID=2886964 RepID=UPI001EF4EB66|nr:MBL fold metallo-hydrolase [Candidatus Nitrotoga sp. 1052]CAH1073710.1 Metal-dependent hydrolases of the beta-lactamase superfamily III [Candidatus Nitrotoga sp. 1052]